MTLLHLHAIDDEAVWRTALSSHDTRYLYRFAQSRGA